MLMFVREYEARELMSPNQVAEAFGVAAGTVTRWDREGKLSPVLRTPGGHRRYLRSEVLALRDAARVVKIP
jgi:DNA-binding transcriptional MerR regulator